MLPEMRRKDRAMTAEDSLALLERGYCGRMATAGPDGWPYVVPRVYVLHNGAIYFHATTAHGHTWVNLMHNPKVCFEVDEPGTIHPTGDESECDTSIDFASVVAFGTCALVEDPTEKTEALHALMAKYADPAWKRPAGFPMEKVTAVFRIDIGRMTGKRRHMTVGPSWEHLFQRG